MKYQVIFTNKVAKAIRQLNKKDIPHIIEKAESLAKDPRPEGSKKLSGIQEDFWRIRVGNYRIIYLIKDEIKIVKITKVGHRKDIYRKK
ncbi:type II toxin-antitoxin system RelE family toxin [Catalinimonas niigatensis]|uniref:type II toxin-antitoxin system RelE family toxin n=1 Tax=Catalinimonas niigatensis TaxID=1397264 RepID=UPI002666EC64|nr:type II toxin-antitoxin system RelE/ParE family toxin [Catalinimonas niigatensis]WPP48385.1 type II toxin-antitoxin system RelE/ParE family toxin [Catalinimonas niigatensis]